MTGLIRDFLPRMLEGLGIEDLAVTYKCFDSYDEMITSLVNGGIDLVFPAGGGQYYSEERGFYLSNAMVTAATELVYKGEYSNYTVRHFAVNENNRMQALLFCIAVRTG